MTTLVVLGAGPLGGATAQSVVDTSAVRRVVIVDDAGDVARGKALDLRQASPVLGRDVDVVGASDVAAVVSAQVVVLADRHEGGEWRDDDALSLLTHVRALNGSAVIVCAGAGQLDLVDRVVAERGFDERRIFGSAPEGLRAAMRALAALDAGVGPGDVSLTLLGRAPGHAFIPWTDASVAGLAATSVLGPPALSRLEARLAKLWPPGPLTLGAAAARVVSLASTSGRATVSVHAVLPGSSRGHTMTARLSHRGVRDIATPTLSPRDQVRLDAALRR